MSNQADIQRGGFVEHEALRAFKFTLDPTSAQTEALARHVGAVRRAFNYALTVKVSAHQGWRAEADGSLPKGTRRRARGSTVPGRSCFRRPAGQGLPAHPSRAGILRSSAAELKT
ncbi:helix-turn-helix domain-containing protein [Streptomyces sp. NPDC088090]|uniref:helix-turn-helix domain-containing protein n=1 Tax=Streptomyces sp. NPDC088090 TaxID=3365822 RepID=UPI00384BDC97